MAIEAKLVTFFNIKTPNFWSTKISRSKKRNSINSDWVMHKDTTCRKWKSLEILDLSFYQWNWEEQVEGPQWDHMTKKKTTNPSQTENLSGKLQLKARLWSNSCLVCSITSISTRKRLHLLSGQTPSFTTEFTLTHLQPICDEAKIIEGEAQLKLYFI